MTDSAIDAWLLPIRQALDNNTDAVLFLRMPVYRPDLLKQLAWQFELDFVDLRAELLMPRGLNAGNVSTDTVNAFIAQQPKGLVLHNTDAWLATKSEADRRAWLARIADTSFDKLLIIPLLVFEGDLPDKLARSVQLDPELLPAATLISWFAGQ